MCALTYGRETIRFVRHSDVSDCEPYARVGALRRAGDGRKFHPIAKNAMTFVSRDALRDTRPGRPP